MKGKLLTFPQPAETGGLLSDEALVAACGTGDTAALGVLFERFNVSVYRFLSRYVGPDCQDLDDLVQGTFLEVMRAASRFRHGAAVQTWIFGIAVNVARHHRRSEGRRRAARSDLALLPREPGRSPEHQAERSELRRRLSAALLMIPEELRTAFVMCDLEDLPGAEVAHVLKWPEGTLWRRLHEARKKLRALMMEEEEYESQQMPGVRGVIAGFFAGRRR